MIVIIYTVVYVNACTIRASDSAIEVLFAEELGVVLEVSSANEQAALSVFREVDVTCHVIGHSDGFGKDATVRSRLETK